MTRSTIESAEQLIPIDIKSFRSTTRDITFDVYLKISATNIAHVFSRATGLDYKRLAQYIQKGVEHLYIHPDDQDIYRLFISRPAQEIFQDPQTLPEKKIATLINMTEQNMSELFTQLNINDETAENTEKLIKNYVNIMINNPETLTVILKLASHGDYLYYHSVAVSIMSMFIAKASGQFNQRMLELVGLGGFLHDIGCTQLPKEVVCSSTELTLDQWREIHSHPKLGMKMTEGTQYIPDEVRYIIYQHHEQPSSRGYPNHLHGPVIYYPAKIVALADCFSALISKRPFRPAYSVPEALSIIKNSEGKFDRDLAKVLAVIFEPKRKY